MNDSERAARAEARRATMWIRKTRLGDETDPAPVTGAEAISLAWRLTQQAWSLSGQPMPSYRRDQIPFRFVPNPR